MIFINHALFSSFLCLMSNKPALKLRTKNRLVFVLTQVGDTDFEGVAVTVVDVDLPGADVVAEAQQEVLVLYA